MPKLKRLLTDRQAAEIVSVSVRTIARWRATGKLRFVRLGDHRQSRVRIPEAWLFEDLRQFGLDVSGGPSVPRNVVDRDYQELAERLGL